MILFQILFSILMAYILISYFACVFIGPFAIVGIIAHDKGWHKGFIDKEIQFARQGIRN